jgi:hypothetical protein
MNDKELAAVKQAVEALEKCRDGFEFTRQYVGSETLPAIEGWSWYDGDVAAKEAITDLQSIISQDALDKMAENARELGLDYEPALMQQPATLDEMHAIGNGIMYGEQPAPVQEPLSFNCSAGCGSCGVKLQDFVTHQTQAQEGDEWVVVATEPQIVSTCCGSPVEVWDERKQDITASVDATPPAQPAPVQEPVGEIEQIDIDDDGQASAWLRLHNDVEVGQLLYTTPPAAPVAWMDKYGEIYKEVESVLPTDTPLYTTPPAPQPVPVKTYHDGKPWPVAPKPWVGLTDEERESIANATIRIHGQEWAYATAIEARLKEKNHDQ